MADRTREQLRARLLEVAATRRATVKIGGDVWNVREMEAQTFQAYSVFAASGAKGKDDKRRQEESLALVLCDCVLDDAGEPFLSPEDGLAVARQARLVFPLINKIMELSGFSAGEKKDD